MRIQHRAIPDKIENLADFHPVIQRVYAGRGITDKAQIKRSAAELLPLQEMKGLQQAAEILFSVLQQQQHITIVGDFDADGATSTTLMMLGLDRLGFQKVSFKVPNRFEDGYGLSAQLAEEIVATGTDVIITVDNGISSIEGVQIAKQAGLTVIVTDHHLAGNELPIADAIVNPNQPDCHFPSKNLAGVGVAFYLLLAIRQVCRQQNWFSEQGIAEPNLAEYLDIVALGTVADVVKLDANNRILVHQGLARIRLGRCRPGIKALLNIANKKLPQITASDFGFVIGPRLNAAGRLDDMSLGIRCLLTNDEFQAAAMAEELNQLNGARREIEQGMRVEAEAAVNTLTLLDGQLANALCVFKPDWHQGVIGIVAGRLKEKYYRPAIAFAKANDDTNESDNKTELKGSARSIQGVHIRDVLDEVNTRFPNLIIKFGGHAMAAGLSIYQSQYDEFKRVFEQIVTEHLSEDVLTQVTLTDGSLPVESQNIEFCQLLQQAGPWGQGFAEPSFDDSFHIINQRIVGGKHLKLVVSVDNQVLIDAIHFNADLNIWPNPNIQTAHLVYQLDINEFRGNTSLQLLVSEMHPK